MEWRLEPPVAPGVFVTSLPGGAWRPHTRPGVRPRSGSSRAGPCSYPSPDASPPRGAPSQFALVPETGFRRFQRLCLGFSVLDSFGSQSRPMPKRIWMSSIKCRKNESGVGTLRGWRERYRGGATLAPPRNAWARWFFYRPRGG
jgi:hypothetical protein